MEHIAQVTARIADVRSMTAAVRPPAQAFAPALARQMAASPQVAETATAGALAGPVPGASPPPGASAGVTLGQMLSLFAGESPAAAALAAPAAYAPAAMAPPSDVVAPVAAAPTAPGQLVSPVEGRTSSRFGMRTHPITGQRRMHSGLDIAASSGTPIKAAAAGTVSFAGSRGGYGNLIIVDHGNGMTTRYAHNSRNSVSAGDQVAAGAVIGLVGSTGASTGPHLHFEVRRDGEAVDPAPLLGR